MSKVKIAAGTVDITPSAPSVLGGFRGRLQLSHAVGDRLEANILVISDDKARLVIVTIDALYPGRLLRARLLDDIGLKEPELFLAASHTHFAPMTSPDMPALGIHDAAFVEMVAARITARVRELEGKGREARCTYHHGEASNAMNRRLPRLRLMRSGLRYSWEMGPNPAGEKDERIDSLFFRSDGEQPLALIWNYACHPTDHPDPLTVSADYPGQVRAQLRARFGNIPVLFLQGFSGDTRPAFHGLTPTATGLLRRVLQGPQFRAPSPEEWSEWAGRLARSVVMAVEGPGTPINILPPRAQRHVVGEELLGIGGRGDKPLVWHCVDFGGFQLVAVNAEPVTAYRRLIAPAFGTKPLLVAGCIDQTHGYLPLDCMLPQGGYEVDGFRELFDYRTVFKQGVQANAISPLFTRPVG